MITKKDSNFIWQFNLEEGWFATIPVHNWDNIPEEEFRIHVGERCRLGKVTPDLIRTLAAQA